MPYLLLGKEVKFRPTFGNDTHLKIFNMLTRVAEEREAYQKYQRRYEDTPKAKRLLESLNGLEREVKELIDKNNG